jgi:uncharacterized protein (TIGR00255 family)
MLYSMTGFGRTEGMIGNRQIAVEIKSLNGKQLDIFTKLPSFVRAHEIAIRTMLQNELIRGSVEFSLQIKQDGSARPMVGHCVGIYGCCLTRRFRHQQVVFR